jgi:hypothetical protein
MLRTVVAAAQTTEEFLRSISNIGGDRSSTQNSLSALADSFWVTANGLISNLRLREPSTSLVDRRSVEARRRCFGTRRGAYQIVYESNEAELMVNVVCDHRSDVYRPR